MKKRHHCASNVSISPFATPLFPALDEDGEDTYDLVGEEDGICIRWGTAGSPRIWVRLSPEKTQLHVTSFPHVISRRYSLFSSRSLVHDLAETFVAFEQSTPRYDGP